MTRRNELGHDWTAPVRRKRRGELVGKSEPRPEGEGVGFFPFPQNSIAPRP